MVKFRLYKGGLDEVSMEFDNPEELKNNPECKGVCTNYDDEV